MRSAPAGRWSFLLVVVLGAASSALAAGAATVHVAPGAQEVLRVGGVTRIAVADPSIADVQLAGREELVIQGRKLGRTSLTLWFGARTESRSIVVDDGRASELTRLVHDQVNPGLRVSEAGSHIVIEGNLDSQEELARLRALVGDDARIKLLVRLDPAVMRVLAERITRELAAHGLDQAKAVLVGNTLFLEGSVPEPQDRLRAQRIAEAIYGSVTSNL